MTPNDITDVTLRRGHSHAPMHALMKEAGPGSWPW